MPISYIISDVMMMWMKVVERILSFCFRIGVAVGAHGLEECVGWILKFCVVTYHIISYVMLTWMMWCRGGEAMGPMFWGFRYLET